MEGAGAGGELGFGHMLLAIKLTTKRESLFTSRMNLTLGVTFSVESELQSKIHPKKGNKQIWPLEGNRADRFRNVDFDVFACRLRIWRFLTSDSTMACRNIPGNKFSGHFRSIKGISKILPGCLPVARWSEAVTLLSL